MTFLKQNSRENILTTSLSAQIRAHMNNDVQQNNKEHEKRTKD